MLGSLAALKVPCLPSRLPTRITNFGIRTAHSPLDGVLPWRRMYPRRFRFTAFTMPYASVAFEYLGTGHLVVSDFTDSIVTVSEHHQSRHRCLSAKSMHEPRRLARLKMPSEKVAPQLVYVCD